LFQEICHPAHIAADEDAAGNRQYIADEGLSVAPSRCYNPRLYVGIA